MRVGVIGGGTMGLGIAHAFAVTGSEVTLVEPDGERRTAALTKIGSVLGGGVARGSITAETAAAARGHVGSVGTIEELDDGLDVVVEAVPEIPTLKGSVLAAAEARAPRLLATNTSSIEIGRLAEGLDHPERFIGLHFFNPVWSMALVEIVVGASTAAETIERSRVVVAELGKEAIVVQDRAGFASSRLGLVLGLEAIRMLEEGVASAEDIDTALRVGYGHPMGPLRLTDLIGLDVRLDIARNLATVYGDRFAPPRILAEKVAQGHLGAKSGQGFYEWPRS